MQDLFSLQDKVVLITGGYGYLGTAITKGLLKCGATVVVLARNKEKFEETFSNQNVSFQYLDIDSSKSIKEAYQAVFDNHGKIDALINNAFHVKGNKPESLSDDEWNESIDGSLNSIYRCIREVLPFMKKNKGGRIINVSSMYGMVAPDFSVYTDFPQFLNPPHYGAAKAGVVQLTKYFASFLGTDNILVNAVSPGPFPSEAVQKNVGFIEALSSKNPLGRIGKPEELQGIFAFLCSNSSSFITGQNIAVDGGWTSI
ncbi:SDR family oxidoreductase [uncultured Arcticibacterium sp.]|uniref:SDR family NAD(P)-dependent oxidoreductase n=1 Tax=uncultured Arcticibacterium sp. TaxID=2173042 RepID=UPI0030F92108